jgi:hypothetical protein
MQIRCRIARAQKVTVQPEEVREKTAQIFRVGADWPGGIPSRANAIQNIIIRHPVIFAGSAVMQPVNRPALNA